MDITSYFPFSLDNNISTADAPIGSLIGNSMTGIPLPNLTGGAAAPSGASGGVRNFINNNSGGGGWLWISFAVVIGMIIWKHHKK